MNGKQKGSEFERFISKDLSKWILNDPQSKEVLMWRSRNSGGWFTQRSKQGIKENDETMGDISPTHDLAKKFFSKYVIECKAYKDINWINFFKNNKKDPLVKDYNKIFEQAKEFEKDIMFIMKINNKGIFVLSSKYIELLDCHENEKLLCILNNMDGYLYYYNDLISIPYDKFIEE